PSQFVYEGEPEPGAIPTDWAAYRCSHLVQERFGLRFDRKLQHVPYALRRSVIETIESEHPQQVALTRSSRFRDRNDLAIPSMLAHFYGVASGAAVEWPTGGDDDYVYAD